MTARSDLHQSPLALEGVLMRARKLLATPIVTILAVAGLTGLGVATASSASAHCPPVPGGAGTGITASWLDPGWVKAWHQDISCVGTQHWLGQFWDSVEDGYCIEVKRKNAAGNYVTTGFTGDRVNCGEHRSDGTAASSWWEIAEGIDVCGIRMYRGNGNYDTFSFGHGYSTACP